jgi:hypothetical protein
VCPAKAIFAPEELPGSWTHFAERNEEYFRPAVPSVGDLAPATA